MSSSIYFSQWSFIPQPSASRLWLFQWFRVITRWPSVSPTPRSLLLVPGCGVNNGHQLLWSRGTMPFNDFNDQNILQNEYPHLTLTWDSPQWPKGSYCPKERILIMLWGLNFACGQWKMLKSFHPECVCVLEDNISLNNLTDHRGDLCHDHIPGLWLADTRAPSRDHYRIITTHFISQHPLRAHSQGPPPGHRQS